MTIDEPLRDDKGNPTSTRRKAQVITGDVKQMQGEWVFINRNGIAFPFTMTDKHVLKVLEI